MKPKFTSLFLLFLLTTSLYAKDKPLRYKLNVGDEFYYIIQSTPSDTFQYAVNEEWLKFNVLSKSENGYELTFQFIRIKTNNQSYKYDTKNSLFQNNINERLKKFIVGKSIPFHLSNTGKVKPIEISKKIKDEFFEKAHVIGLLEKYSALKLPFFDENYLTYLIQSVFPNYPDNNITEWTNPSKANRFLPELINKYRLIDSKPTEIDFRLESKNVNVDTLQLSSEMQMVWIEISTQAKIRVTKNTGLLQDSEGATQSHSKYILTKNGSAEVESYESRQSTINSIRRIEAPNSSSKVILSGTISHELEIDSIQFFLWNNFPDRDIFRHTVKVDKNNQFIVQTVLPRETEIAYALYPSKGSKPIYMRDNLLVEPGDSIHINIAKNKSIQFSGNGSYKSTLSQKIRNMGELLDERKEQKTEKAKVLRSIDLKLSEIEQQKDSLSAWAINQLNTNAYFAEYSKLLNYYYHKNERKVNPQMFEELFAEFDVNKYTASTSYDFRFFIDSYIFRKQLILKGYKENRSSPNPESYLLAKMLLNDELKYYTLAYYVYEGLKDSKKTEYESIYNDFQELYPASEFAEILREKYKSRVDLANGSKAPEFSLKTLDGEKTVSLSDFKGKWVMVTFCEINHDHYKRDVLAFQNMVKELPKENFELLIAFSQNDKNETEKFLKENDIKGILLDNHGWKHESTKKYHIEQQATNFLINPEGIIEFSGSGDPREDFIEIFIDYIKQTSTETNNASLSKEALFGFLGGILLLAALFFGIYKWRISIIRKREKRQREKLELEMQAVRSQLNPHFLFNSMNSIQHLVNADQNEKANLFLSKFGSLMRKVLNQSELSLIPLKEELETIETYLELEALRHNFSYSIEAEKSIDIYTIEVPPLLLQPFVENAVIHGINGYNNGEIKVEVRQVDLDIQIRIIDNGTGLGKSRSTQSNGLGLQITQKRVDLLMENYKNKITFNLKNRSEIEKGKTGTVAEITFALEN